MQKNRVTSFPMLLAALVCFGLILSASSVLAADPKISAGAGVAMVPDYEGSDDSTGAPALLFDAKWASGRYIKLAGNSVRANVLANESLSLGPVLQYRAERDDVDNDAVDDMRKIDAAVEAGAFIGYKQDAWDFSLQYVADVSDSHDGSLGKVMAGYSFASGKFNTRIGVSSTYADDDYMDTYFSVDSNNASRSGLSEYSADGGVKDVGTDVTVRYGINEKWAVMGLLGFKKLLGDAKDSPVVDDEGNDSQATFGLLAVYNF